MADEKTVIAGGDRHLEVTDTDIQGLEAAGLKKTGEREIKAHNTEYAAAITEQKPNPWGKGYLLLYCYCFVIYLCSTMNG